MFNYSENMASMYSTVAPVFVLLEEESCALVIILTRLKLASTNILIINPLSNQQPSSCGLKPSVYDLALFFSACTVSSVGIFKIYEQLVLYLTQVNSLTPQVPCPS